MDVTVKLFATFRTGRFGMETRQYPQGTTVKDILAELDIPEEEIGAILVQGRHVEEDCELHNADTLSIFPLVGGG